MWVPTKEELRRRRLELGLTQKQVAERAGVSQPLVARIEKGSVDPRTSTLSKILAVLNAFDTPQAETARHVMTHPIVSVRPKDSVRRVALLMTRGGYSQLPVMEAGRIIGSITERRLVEEMARSEDLEGLARSSVEPLVQPGPPEVPAEENLEALSHLLDVHPLVVVSIAGRPVGVVTKADLVKRLGEKGRH